MNSTDLTFITNLSGQTLKDRFNALIKDTRFFDVLVGYFYVSGFYAIYKSLENTEKIRILIGISTTKQTFELIEKGRHLSQKEAKELVEEEIIKEFEDSEDKKEVEEGILKFVEWISTGKLEIRAYPERNLHAKLYIQEIGYSFRNIVEGFFSIFKRRFGEYVVSKKLDNIKTEIFLKAILINRFLTMNNY